MTTQHTATQIFLEEVASSPPPIFLSVKASCFALNLGKTSIHALLREEKLAYVKHGRRTLVYRQSVIEYAASLAKNGGAS